MCGVLSKVHIVKELNLLTNSHGLRPQSEQHEGSEESRVRFYKLENGMRANTPYFVEYRENLFSPFVMEHGDAVAHFSCRYCVWYSARVLVHGDISLQNLASLAAK